MSKILCIDTAADICSVAVSIGEKCLDYMEDSQERSHAQMLSILIDRLLLKNELKLANIDAIAVSKGPGSYTGLRIGVSLAKGICYATNKPLIAISTLQIIAAHFLLKNEDKPQRILIPTMDARRMEVYMAQYTSNLKEQIPATPLVVEPDSFSALKNEKQVYFIGSGAQKCKEILTLPNAKFFPNIQNHAKYMCILASEKYDKQRFENVAYFEPAYLKPFIATQSKKKLS